MGKTLFVFLLLVGNALAYTCNTSYCDDDRLGIGAHYSSLKSPLSQAHNTGAYLSIYSGYHWQRLYVAVDTLVGFTRPIFTSLPTLALTKRVKPISLALWQHILG